jgi:acetylornithine deacetylase/succinyl-diaminopimelate desuccinylase-like protein
MLGCTAPGTVVGPTDDRLAVDWEAAGDEVAALLSAYLQVDTSNPPGREGEAAAFLAERLQAEGIASRLLAFAPGRANLVARPEGSGEARPLCLLSHMDVATAEADAWTHPPFSGHIDDAGEIWGRGALDMKGLGALELLTLVWLKRLDLPLTRDVVLVAVGDEEVGNTGMAALIEDHWPEIDCSHVINEGGLGVEGGLVDGVTTFGVSFAEKGVLWARVVAEGEPGHGSTPLPDTAPARLLGALERLRAFAPEPEVHPELRRLLAAVGERAGGVEGWVLQTLWATDLFAMGALLDNPLAAATITNTVQVTGFGGAAAPNVLPGEAWAQVDARLLPGTTPDAFLAELERVVDDPHVRFEVLQAEPAYASPTDDPLYRAITGQLRAALPEAAVGPLLMMGSTDSSSLRALGVHAYGVAPFVLPVEQLRGMHGDDEHLSRDNLQRGLEILLRVVTETSVSPASVPAP